MAELPSATPGVVNEPDWTDQVTDLVVDVVDRVHDATTGRIVGLARALVYGTVAAIVSIGVLIMGIILMGHLLDLLPGPIWIPYMIIGILMVLGGFLLWSRRRAPAT